MISFEVTIAGDDAYRVSWRLSGTEFAGDTKVEVLRSPSFTGPFETILPPSGDVTDFVDTFIESRLVPFYRIRVYRHGQEPRTYPATGGVTIAPEQDGEIRAVIRERIRSIRHGGGRKVLYYPVKATGPRCSCYDEVSRKSEVRNCRSCFGSSYFGGFFNPILIHAAIGSPSDQFSERFRVSGQVSSAIIPNLPIIRQGDVVIEKENKRWRILGNDPAEYKRNIIRQTIFLAPLSIDDIIFELPADFTLLGSDKAVVAS